MRQATNDLPSPNYGMVIEHLLADLHAYTQVEPKNPSLRRQQSRHLSHLSQEIDELLPKVNTLLEQTRRNRKRQGEHKEIRRKYVKVALARLYIKLIDAWNDAALYWDEVDGQVDTTYRQIEKALRSFNADIAHMNSKLDYLCYHLIATAFHVWSDEFSPEAATAAGWLERAPDIGHTFRLRYHHYHTRELWIRAWSKEPFIFRSPPFPWKILPLTRLGLFGNACIRLLYEGVAGYGLRGWRFLKITLSSIIGFGLCYWLIDFLTPHCSPSPFPDKVLFSIGVFTTVGNISAPICPADALWVQRVAMVESLIGYLMLGILISIILASYHESLTVISGRRQRESDGDISPSRLPWHEGGI